MLGLIAIGNTLRLIASNCAENKTSPSDKLFFGNVQVGCGTGRGAEIAAHSFRNLIERDDNQKCAVLLKLDFKNAFYSLNRETYTHCAYSKPSYLFYEINILHNVRRRNSARWFWSPTLFAEIIHTLVKQMESKNNIWYSDDGNLADDYQVVLRDLKNILANRQNDLSLNTEKREFCFLVPTTSTRCNSILTQFRKKSPIKNKNKRSTPHFRISNRETLPKRLARRKK